MANDAEQSVLLDLPGEVLMQIIARVDPQSCSESLAITSHSLHETLTRTGTRRPRPHIVFTCSHASTQMSSGMATRRSPCAIRFAAHTRCCRPIVAQGAA